MDHRVCPQFIQIDLFISDPCGQAEETTCPCVITGIPRKHTVQTAANLVASPACVDRNSIKEYAGEDVL